MKKKRMIKRPANRPINLALACNSSSKRPEYFFGNIQAVENSEMNLGCTDLYKINMNNSGEKLAQ
jgi:hypothetical protein